MAEQIIFNGIKAYRHIADILQELGIRKLLLVCGKSYEQMEIREFLAKLDVAVIRFSGFSPNPIYENIYDGAALFKREKCQAILAVGGGSAIDTAKCIKLFSHRDLAEWDNKIPVIAMPTTAGSGSESTQHAVIYCQGEKRSITHASILPEYVILDPAVLKGLPVYQKKCTLMDALCQGIESWWSVRSTKESRAFAKAAVKGIVAHWREYIEKNSEAAAEKIQYAANLAGKAINITATTAAHAMSYKLTSMYGLPHGHAVAVCLPEVWEHMSLHMGDCVDQRGEKYVKAVFQEINNIIDVPYFRGMMSELGLSKPVQKNSEDILLLTESVNAERLNNNPIALGRYVLWKLYERILSDEG